MSAFVDCAAYMMHAALLLYAAFPPHPTHLHERLLNAHLLAGAGDVHRHILPHPAELQLVQQEVADELNRLVQREPAAVQRYRYKQQQYNEDRVSCEEVNGNMNVAAP